MKKIYVLILALVVLSFSLPDDPLTKITAGFARYVHELPQEKIYIHFDKPYYTSGETIWLKAYLSAGVDHKPSPLSRTIYVELINETGQLIKRLNLYSETGSVAGNIQLPDSLPSGNYMVRSYTNWMRNNDEDYFFHRQIKIWKDNIAATKNSRSHELDIHFFPEGGDLVNGIVSKVAFKAIGADGSGKSIKGKILSGTEVICEFKSNAFGMGIFSLSPKAGKQYQAVIENYDQEITLPAAKESGLVMSASHSLKSTDVIVKMQTTDFASLKTIYILAQTRGLVCYAARVDLSKNFAVVKIPKKEFISGVAQITITDSNGVPLTERLIFINNEDEKVTFTATPDKETYAPRELVTLKIQTHDAAGNPVPADLSLAVCDDQGVRPDDHKESINAYLLLSSELKGHIESPGYYFNPNNADREEALDILMLTQGWRRFTIKKALENNWEKPLYKIEQGLTIKGTLVNKNNNKPVPEGKVSYLTLYPAPETKTVTTNADGSFEIDNVIYFGTSQAMFQGETKNGNKSVKILIDSAFDFPRVQSALYPLGTMQSEFEKDMIAKSVAQKEIDKSKMDRETITLEEVEVRAEKEKSPATVSRAFGSGTINLKVEGNPALENQIHPFQIVQGRVAGVQVSGSGRDWKVSIRGTSSILSGTTPMFMIDDMPVPIESINLLPVSEIESFTVWKGPDTAIFGARGANGVIGFYTKKKIGGQLPPSNSITFAGTSFETEREFYAPRYDVQKPEHAKPDKRVTLFWAPYIRTDSSGQASVSFYNHDTETNITGTLEGITPSGNSASATFKYSITKK